MELKLWMILCVTLICTVLIVPLWNWNVAAGRWSIGGEMGSNRTFMELKWQCGKPCPLSSPVLIVPLWNWNVVIMSKTSRGVGSNRTFMELKSAAPPCSILRHGVLIVPLWNWNYEPRRQNDAGQLCSNRTFMELKWWTHNCDNLLFHMF